MLQGQTSQSSQNIVPELGNLTHINGDNTWMAYICMYGLFRGRVGIERGLQNTVICHVTGGSPSANHITIW